MSKPLTPVQKVMPVKSPAELSVKKPMHPPISAATSSRARSTTPRQATAGAKKAHIPRSQDRKTATSSLSRQQQRKKPVPTIPVGKTTTPKAPVTATAAPGNWLNRQFQSRIAAVGSYAGGIITSVGNGVNTVGAGIGNSIADTTRYWGQGVSGYGNDIKDAVGVGGPRVATAGNPLGLAGAGQGRGAIRVRKEIGSGNVAGPAKSSAGNPLGV